MAGLYFASAVGGTLFSIMLSDSCSVGASTAGFGILTGILALLFVNWSAFNGNPQLEQTRCILVAMVIFFILINLMMGAGSQGNSIDTYGHLGGALAGLFWGMACFPRETRNQTGQSLRKWGLGRTSVFFSLQIILFYTVKKPLDIC